MSRRRGKSRSSSPARTRSHQTAPRVRIVRPVRLSVPAARTTYTRRPRLSTPKITRSASVLRNRLTKPTQRRSAPPKRPRSFDVIDLARKHYTTTRQFDRRSRRCVSRPSSSEAGSRSRKRNPNRKQFVPWCERRR